MRTKITLFIAALLLLGAASLHADPTGSAVATVVATVDPNIAVGTITSVVSPPNVQMGDFTAEIVFRVDANTQKVKMSIEATGLYKGAVVGGEVPPIPLNLLEGALIEPTDATPLGGGDPIAPYVGDTMIEEFPAKQTAEITFESGQNNHFSQDVIVTITWNQDDPEKPTGEYTGKVRLTAMVVPGP
jgi:hypothetical protein